MGNLRDGGIIIVGVSEDDDRWTLTGISNLDLIGYDPDEMMDQINAYVSPYVDVDIVSVEHEKNIFLAIRAREFAELPLVCKKNGPNNSDLVEGAVYVRPAAGRPRTTRITKAEEMRDLLELAAEKRARQMLETGRRIGQVDMQTTRDLFDKEIKDL